MKYYDHENLYVYGIPFSPQSLEVDFSFDSIIITERTVEVALSTVPLSHDLWHFRSSPSPDGSVFSLLQHCRCFFTEGGHKLLVVVATVKYSSEADL